MNRVSALPKFVLSAGLVFVCMSAGGAPDPGPSPGLDPTPARVAPPGPASIFPLQSEHARRYLLDSRGHPFLVQGDAAWSLIVQLERDDAERYLAKRRSQGFNTILVNLIEHKFSPHAPRNAYGAAPFLKAGDFSTPNEAYFDHAAQVVESAAEKGILVLLTPAYMGYDGTDEGWYREMAANGPAKLRDYGRFVGRRFRAYDNVVWVHGGDFKPPEQELLRAVADGIRDVDPSSLHTFHASRGTSALEYFGHAEPWLALNTLYTDEANVVPKALREYGRSTLPFFLIEARYEGEKGAGDAIVRRQAYQALLSGACGQLMGNNPVWKFADGWQAALDSAGARSQQRLRALMDTIAWWRLRPDARHRFLVAGAGSGLRAVAAIDPGGDIGVVFIPSVRAVTLDLGALKGPRVLARWYDPASGGYLPAAGSSLAAAGMQVFSPNGYNAGGAEDWVLLLQSVP